MKSKKTMSRIEKVIERINTQTNLKVKYSSQIDARGPFRLEEVGTEHAITRRGTIKEMEEFAEIIIWTSKRMEGYSYV